MRLPERGPWPHPYFETPDETLAVQFRDAEGDEREVATRHKVTGSGTPLVLVHGLMTMFGDRYADDIRGAPLHWIADSSHFVQVEQPARTVTEIRDFDQGGAAS